MQSNILESGNNHNISFVAKSVEIYSHNLAAKNSHAVYIPNKSFIRLRSVAASTTLMKIRYNDYLKTRKYNYYYLYQCYFIMCTCLCIIEWHNVVYITVTGIAFEVDAKVPFDHPKDIVQFVIYGFLLTIDSIVNQNTECVENDFSVVFL